MTNARFNRLCSDIEKIARQIKDKPSDILTEQELDERIFFYLSKLFGLPKEEIIRRLK